MRPLVLLGIALIAIGCLFLYNGGHFTTRKKVLEVGDVKVTTADEHTLPGWVPAFLLLGGGAMVLIGVQRGNRS
jgi:hypothetical protein